MSWLTEIKHQPKVLISRAGERTGAVQIALWIVDLSMIAFFILLLAIAADAFTDRWEFEHWVRDDLGFRQGKKLFAMLAIFYFWIPVLMEWFRRRLKERQYLVGAVTMSAGDRGEAKKWARAFLFVLPIVTIKFAIIFLIVWIFF